MSTGQNTQRISGYCVHNWTDLVNPCPDCEETKQPPPETGAVDVDACVLACMERLRRNAKELCKDEGYLFWDNGLSILREHFKPLTQRIQELEAINRELEQKLEAALKLTTDNSITHVGEGLQKPITGAG